MSSTEHRNPHQQWVRNKAKINKQIVAGSGFLWFIEVNNFHHKLTRLRKPHAVVGLATVGGGSLNGGTSPGRADGAPPSRPRYKHLRRRTEEVTQKTEMSCEVLVSAEGFFEKWLLSAFYFED